MSRDLHLWPISRVRAAFSDKALRPSDYVDHQLQRIERHDGQLNSLIALDREGVCRASAEADLAYARGQPRGALDGILVAVKDVIDVKGMATTCHSRLRLGHVAPRDAVSVARLREAGSIIIGKTATHEFAVGGPAFDLPFPPARNPWDRDRHPGGSSSGSGAGVAAGFFPAAIGTDTGGSVRHPASGCGIVGLKPTYDAIPRDGVFPLAFSLDHVGTLARTVADAALLCDVMSAGVTRASEHLGHGVSGLRVGFVRHFHTRDIVATTETTACLDGAAERLLALGAVVQDVELPSLNSFAACNRIILQAEAMSVHGAALRREPENFSALTRRAILPALFLTAEDLVNAQRRRGELMKATERALDNVDILLTASSMEPPCRIDDRAEIVRSYGRQARTPFNVTGHPAIAIRSGMTKDGLPLSLQIAGHYGGEATICRAAAALELPFVAPPFGRTEDP